MPTKDICKPCICTIGSTGVAEFMSQGRLQFLTGAVGDIGMHRSVFCGQEKGTNVEGEGEGEGERMKEEEGGRGVWRRGRGGRGDGGGR